MYGEWSNSMKPTKTFQNSQHCWDKLAGQMSGSENSKPVHIGNAVYNQKQNNSLGYLMDVIYNYYLLFSGNLDKIEGCGRLSGI